MTTSDEALPTRLFRRFGASRLAGLAAIAVTVAGCGAPPPGTSGLTQGGQQCEVCRHENPGDNAACYAVCLPSIQDQWVGRGAPHP